MAIELTQNPSLLDGKELVFDKVSGEQIEVEQLQSALQEFYGDIQTMTLIKKGMIHLSLADYLMMPVTGRMALEIFEKVVTDVKPSA